MSQADPYNMTGRQRVFADTYIATGSVEEAGKAAGYKYPASQGTKSLDPKQSPNVVRYIREQQAKVAERSQLSAQRVVEELALIALCDPGDFYDDKGRIKPIHQMPERARRCIGEFKVTTRKGLDPETGEVVDIPVTEIKLASKLGALEQLAKHLGVLKDNGGGTTNNTFNIVAAIDMSAAMARQPITDPVDIVIEKEGGK